MMIDYLAWPERKEISHSFGSILASDRADGSWTNLRKHSLCAGLPSEAVLQEREPPAPQNLELALFQWSYPIALANPHNNAIVAWS
jgi:hypothetical protein